MQQSLLSLNSNLYECKVNTAAARCASNEVGLRPTVDKESETQETLTNINCNELEAAVPVTVPCAASLTHQHFRCKS